MSSFLHKLWDETLAGPTPDNGLGKLRKYDPVSASESSSVKISGDVPVTRSITILRRRNYDFRNLADDRDGRMIDSPRTPLTREFLFVFRSIGFLFPVYLWLMYAYSYILCVSFGNHLRRLCVAWKFEEINSVI